MTLNVGPLKPEPLRQAIAHSIWAHVKAYDVSAVCERLGMEAARDGRTHFAARPHS